jgi:hypothetical protein
MASRDPHILPLGITNFREDRRRFGIRRRDRRQHVYVIGQTGTGKSTLLETMIRSDLDAGEGLALLDPHGDLVDRIRRAVPGKRLKDLVYFDVPRSEGRYGFNPLRNVPGARRAVAASGLLDAFRKFWEDSWGPRLEHILRNALLTLLEQPEATLADVLRLLNDEHYRRAAVLRVENAQVRAFWLNEYGKYPARFQIEAIAPIQNKVGAFLADPLLYRLLTERRQAFDLQDVMDRGKVLLVNLSKGELGQDSAGLLGALLVTAIGNAAFTRSNRPIASRRDFWLYLDEFHTFTTMSVVSMLSELRKYRVGLILAHQYLAQLELPVRDAILGNVGTLIAFRVGASDAELLEQEVRPPFTAGDLTRLPNHHVYLKLLVDGVPSPPFSAETVRPWD